MRKLYYDCPILAAYMAKNFDVRFVFTVGGELHELMHWTDLFPPSESLLYYVRPCCYKIFEPQEGDLIEADMAVGKYEPGDFQVILYKESCPNGMMSCVDKDGEFLTSKDRFSKIIQRNGKPFITPKQEGAA